MTLVKERMLTTAIALGREMECPPRILWESAHESLEGGLDGRLDSTKQHRWSRFTQNAGAAAEVDVGVSATGFEYVPHVP